MIITGMTSAVLSTITSLLKHFQGEKETQLGFEKTLQVVVLDFIDPS